MTTTPFRLLLAGLLAASLTAACKNTETPVAAPEDPAEAAVTEPVRHYPALVGASHPHADGASIDDTVSIRTFTIPTSQGESTTLSAAYLDQMAGRPDEDSRVMILADLNAAFISSFNLKVPPGKHWRTANVLVGEFSQDYCGDIRIVHYFESDKVTAVSIDDSPLVYELLTDSKCPVKEDYPISDTAPPAPGTDPFGDFCNARDKCLKNYFSDPARVDRLRRSLPQALIDLHLE